MKKLQNMTYSLAKASNGNPVISTATVMLFYVMFNLLEVSLETLIFGERFHHWLDPLFQLAFIAYSAYAVWWCAVFNGTKENITKTISGAKTPQHKVVKRDDIWQQSVVNEASDLKSVSFEEGLSDNDIAELNEDLYSDRDKSNSIRRFTRI